MNQVVQEQILSGMHLSKAEALNEISFLYAASKCAEFQSEVDYLEKKYQKSFKQFDKDFAKKRGSLETENDWMDWKFAAEALHYWKSIFKKIS